MTHKVIAIDGPAGSGKSTVAKSLAKRLGIYFLDTGAMYRALTYFLIQNDIGFDSEEAMVAAAKSMNLNFEETPEGLKVLVNGRDVSKVIRTTEITDQVHHVASSGSVRNVLVQWQQEFGKNQSLVAEGRDIGTVVFPDTKYKFYVDADIKIRAQRRKIDFADAGEDVSQEELIRAMEERDRKDCNRDVGPLKKAEDAIVIDSGRGTVEDTVDEILEHIKRIETNE